MLPLVVGCPKAVQPTDPQQRTTELAAMTFPLCADDYPWPRTTPVHEPLVYRFPPPAGAKRTVVAEGSWAQWLRHLPLRPPDAPVVSVSGSTIWYSDSRYVGAVIDMDERKNQECADVILRLRAEYLRWAGREDEIVFSLTGPGTISWPEWQAGMRPRLEGSRLNFYRAADPDDSRQAFDSYLASAFAWCGTLSLSKDGEAAGLEEVRIGDFFAHGGSPGHAAIIADLARGDNGQVWALLLQGYMPAQSAHVLRAEADEQWFLLVPGEKVELPAWGTFDWSELRRFGEQ